MSPSPYVLRRPACLARAWTRRRIEMHTRTEGEEKKVGTSDQGIVISAHRGEDSSSTPGVLA